jgi:hypothetical protein
MSNDSLLFIYRILQPCSLTGFCAIVGQWAGGFVVNTRGGLRVSADRPGDHAILTNNMKILDIPQSGRQGTFVSVRTRYGQVRRRYAVPRDPHSPAQVRIRSAFGRVVARWRALKEEQRAAWKLATENVYSRTRLGQRGLLSGYLFFIKINSALAYQGTPLVDTPPARVDFDENPVGPLVATNTDGVIDLKLSVPSAPATPVLVMATGPRSAGVTFAKHFTILGVLPPAEAGYSNITAMYLARYGAPKPGMRIFVRTRQVLNGWEDISKQTTAIVTKT